MKITFELNGKQAAVLMQILALPPNKGKDENEACRILVVQCLVNAKQQIVAQELNAN